MSVPPRGYRNRVSLESLELSNKAVSLNNKIVKYNHIGVQLANACFNLSQNSWLSSEDRETLAELVRLWDQRNN